MFRSLFRGPRTIRVPIDSRNVEVQQVKVTKQSRPVVARFILTCVVTTVLIQGMKRWDPLGTYAQRDVLQEELEKVKKDVQNANGDRYGKHWDKQHSHIKGSQITDESDGHKSDDIRITVPIWLRKGHQRMYRETDPEWKEFVKLQGDCKRLEQIRRQIADSVLHQVKDHGRNKFELAVIKFNGRVAINIDMVPQVFTPPVYEVPCLWISASAINAGWRPLPPQTGARMERVFRPVVLLEASTAAMKTFFWITYAVTKARLMEGMGWENSGGHKSTISMPRIPPQPQNTDDVPSVADSKSTKPFFPLFPDLGNSDTMRKMHSDVVSSMPYSTAIQHAAFTFNLVRMTRQRQAVLTNVKGICQFRGYITFFGERGRYRLDVIAHYLPADNVFVGAVSVPSGYLVQDFQAWDKQIQKEKQQKRLQETSSKDISSSDKSNPTEPTPPSDPKEDKEKNK